MGAWLLWKHRNLCVFEGANPCIEEMLCTFRDEHHLWSMAGARHLVSLSTGPVAGAG
ncbi:hypothetical protein PR202_gb03376 [Eleusine coracana subsp. coracana]|uniref:Uncharacterized protein n=1 Tax=Eleusine coracana subsp. coracana TaxID=191504 RepID=A0AAV5DZB0_ELECO|nr:hypothetical protein PR202_gb03376 [Eleusine coracana subsp. coracana]